MVIDSEGIPPQKGDPPAHGAEGSPLTRAAGGWSNNTADSSFNRTGAGGLVCSRNRDWNHFRLEPIQRYTSPRTSPY